MSKEKNLLESSLEGKGQSDLFTLINLVPFLNIILFIVSIILLPFNLKKFFKLKKQKDNSFW
ncbi:hypothetical protein LW893_05140 [Parvimonas micra]|jgi:hypothetical protein|uniref:hypothetical protein n=1 Tax=Parvimonas micra TaxID=33033 RepID=UPI001E3B5ED6|nr:hypothetical protein [Parvimonas micra]MCE3020323.1 hypothetical protein [Parvimonas micra]